MQKINRKEEQTMLDIIRYDYKTTTFRKFCTYVDISYWDTGMEIKKYAEEHNVSLEEAVTVFFPEMYINIIGTLVTGNQYK